MSINSTNLSTLFEQYGVKPSGDPQKDLEALGMTKDEAESIFGAPSVSESQGPQQPTDVESTEIDSLDSFQPSGDPEKDLETLMAMGFTKEEVIEAFGEAKDKISEGQGPQQPNA